jgi:hypothetical protein
MKNTSECPQCRGKEGFRKNLSRLRKDQLQKILFKCPNFATCGLELPYSEAEKHIQLCKNEIKEQQLPCSNCSQNNDLIDKLLSFSNNIEEALLLAI